MNLLEHYILEVKAIEEIPEHDVSLLDENDIYRMPKSWRLTAKVDCYGSISVISKIYTNKTELDRDLERGYYEA
ncbi:MAG: hypothetical protein J6J36_07040 [Clostridia bacterium]|nr:hypothetical protein [Clostridia bacterium]